MTAQEMHIGVDILLQKINSNVLDDFEEEEIDWLLNEEVIRFIRNRISNFNQKKIGFEDIQKRFDDVQPLITPLSLSSYIRDNKSVYNYLPHDYLMLVNDRTLTKNLCGGTYNPTTTNEIKNINTIILKDDITFYATFKLSLNGNVIFDIQDYPHYAGGLGSTSAKFELYNLLLDVINEYYPCKYGDYFGITAKGIIVISDIVTSFDIEYTPTDIVTSPSFPLTYSKLVSIDNLDEHQNRLTDTEILYNVLDSAFASTTYDSPVSTLEKNKIIVFHSKKFIPSSINISYIRKPRRINLFLNQNCDLDESVHQEIVDNTAKRIAGLIDSKQYNNIINENLLKE